LTEPLTQGAAFRPSRSFYGDPLLFDQATFGLEQKLKPISSAGLIKEEYETEVGRTEASTARSPVAGTVELVKPLAVIQRTTRI
jgi:hypothetical protein